MSVSRLGSVGAMHLAKGLEFGSVVVMACDDKVIPIEERIEAMATPLPIGPDGGVRSCPLPKVLTRYIHMT
jgi:hypothetical protein